MSMLRNLAVTFGITQLSPLEQATREFTQAQRDLLAAAAGREAFEHSELMLQRRIARLRDQIALLSSNADANPDASAQAIFPSTLPNSRD